jgi:hypothetical protein
MLITSYLGNVLYFIKVNFVHLRINFWFLEPFTIYNMGSNRKLIFVLLVFGFQAVLKEQMKVVTWGITVFLIFVVSYSGCDVFYILLL